MNLIDELKTTGEEAYNKWFDRWYEKRNLPNELKKAAQEGYTSYAIELSRMESSHEGIAYLNRRLRNPKTIEKLEERLPGIKVDLRLKKCKNLIGFTQKEEKLVFSWNEFDNEQVVE